MNNWGLARRAKAICAVETDEELASHSRGLIVMMADEIERLQAALKHIRDGWRHASDCDVSFGRPENECDCYHGVALKAVGSEE